MRNTAVGLKDGGASLHGVWHNLFVPVSSKKKRQNGMASGEDGKYVGRLADVVMSSGDVDRVMQGECGGFTAIPVLTELNTSGHSTRLLRTLPELKAD